MTDASQTTAPATPPKNDAPATPQLLSPVQPSNRGGTTVNMTLNPESIASIIVTERRAQLRADEAESMAKKEKLLEQMREHMREAGDKLLADILDLQKSMLESLQPTVVAGFLQTGQCMRDVLINVHCTALEPQKGESVEAPALRGDFNPLLFTSVQFRADVLLQVFANHTAPVAWPARGKINPNDYMTRPLLTASGRVKDDNAYSNNMMSIQMGTFAPPAYIHAIRSKYEDAARQINEIDRRLVQLRKLLNSLGEVRDTVMAELAHATLERLPDGVQVLERLRSAVSGAAHLLVEGGGAAAPKV